MILAIVLSAIVLIGWGFVSERFLPTANPPATKVVKGKTVPVAQPQADPAADSPAAIRDRRAVIGETPRLAVSTPRLAGSINLKGARIDDLVLTTHREGIAANSPPVRLLSPAGTQDAYFASFGWTGDGLQAPGPDTLWTASGPRLAPDSPVTLSAVNARGQRFEIGLAVDDGYMFTVSQRVTNPSAAAISARPYALVSRANASKDPTSWTNHVGPVGVFDGSANYSWNYKKLAEEATSISRPRAAGPVSGTNIG
jgi:YidC/Oxa1 family membrane protein insertase